MKVKEYIRMLEAFGPSIAERYQEIYGDFETLIEQKKRNHLRVLRLFGQTYGMDREAVLVRSPSRVNLLGMHIEHKGGYVNPVGIGYEMLIVASGRNDDIVNIKNIESKDFPDEQFSIRELMPADYDKDWLTYLNESTIEQGHWQNYVRAPVLRLQMAFPHMDLKGMDMMVSGDIPKGGGVSSSSALVVSSAIATVELNKIDVDRKELTVLCGEGEWYVGTRGGFGDQGAMLLAKQNCITHMRFFPMIVENIPLPENHVVLLCKSFVDAHKASGARSIFNERVSTYDIAMMLIRKMHPEIAHRIRYIRDIHPNNLGVNHIWIYELLRDLPERMNREDILQQLPDQREQLEIIFNSHDVPQNGYKIRQVLLYGIAECARADIAGKLLKNGNSEEFGRIMFVSHNGDRVVSYDEDGNESPYDSRVTNDYLNALITRLKEDPCAGTAQLHWQPGGYACSHEKVDRIVDILSHVPGVLGARLTGAGLGGCVLALVPEKDVDTAIHALNEKYYGPLGLPHGAEICVSVEGAGVL